MSPFMASSFRYESVQCHDVAALTHKQQQELGEVEKMSPSAAAVLTKKDLVFIK